METHTSTAFSGAVTKFTGNRDKNTDLWFREDTNGGAEHEQTKEALISLRLIGETTMCRAPDESLDTGFTIVSSGVQCDMDSGVRSCFL